MDIFRDFTDLVEPLSLDEAYLDITAAVNEAEGRWPLGVALELKRRVKDETGLTVSVGVSASKYVSKIASDLQKPDGLVVVPPGDEAGFLAPLAVGKLWGIGPKTAERLNSEGVDTIGDLASQSAEWFARNFGQRAESVRLRAVGQDNEPVHTERVTKSVSSETTFPDDIGDTEELHRVLDELAGGVAGSLERKGLQGRTVTVKMRLADFTTFSRQSTLPQPSNEAGPDTRPGPASTLRRTHHGPHLPPAGSRRKQFRGAGRGASAYALGVRIDHREHGGHGGQMISP